VYFTNSGAEAVEGAMKLAKRVTGRSKIMAFKNAYHGSTQGALSIMGDEYWRNAYRPLLPDVWHEQYNTPGAIDAVDEHTACVVAEVMQAEAGAIPAAAGWLQALRRKCTETGALLVFDEIQTGFGRTGTLWAFEAYGVVPDILLLGKALGGGLPLGAFIASQARMLQLTHNPVLGHISTFAGHPVCCAAGMASFDLLLALGRGETSHIFPEVTVAADLFRQRLKHPAIRAVHGRGLLMAVEFADAALCQRICHACVAEGIITDWFLFAPHCLRVAPPLNITPGQVEAACAIITDVCTRITGFNP
jgi:acetylornithine/succinyldiaminopimelate/putrescine aminotransferase